MAISSYLKLSRNNIFMFRRRIPSYLLQYFSTNELRISTRTRDKKVAVQIAREIANDSDKLFEKLRNNMADEKQLAKLNTVLEHWREKNDLKKRIEEEFDARLDDKLKNNQLIKALKASHENQLKQKEESYKNTIDVLKELVINDKPQLVADVSPNFSDFFDDFFSTQSLADRNDKPSTIRKDRDGLNIFVEIIGNKPVSDYSQKDAVKFAKEVALFKRKPDCPRAPSTINGYMNNVSKFSNWIVTYHSETGHQKLDFSNLRKPKLTKSSEERDAFTNIEVDIILNYLQNSELKIKEPVKFWLPMIAAYSGARLEEITQLSPQTDIYQTDDIWIFDINNKNDKSLKNNQSIRKIPIHSELLRHGLIEYVLKNKKDSANTLFPSEKVRDGRTGKNAGKRVNRLIRKIIGVNNKSLHSFRHTLATKLKHAGVEESITAEILGHEYGGISYNRYGKAYSVNILFQTIEKIIF